MLFPYTYVPHSMEKMQEFIDFIFFEVWCKAPSSGTFDFALFTNCPELKELMEALYYGHTKGGDFFYSHVENIYGLFAGLTPPQVDQFRQWYQANNDIKRACENDPAIHIVRYKDVISTHPAIGKKLASFFCNLYDKSFLHLAAVREKVGDIKDHNRQFFTINNVGKCPFCGISDLKGIHHTRREAYDHYLPKYRYPFNSINFRNLAPACHECNSTYKLSKDPTRNTVGRRKAFYPYNTVGHSIEITIDLNKPDIDKLAPSDIQFRFGPAEVNQEIETWKDVYGIEERYRGKILDGDGKAWLVEVFDEWRWKDESAGEEGRSPDEYLRDLRRHAAKSRFTGTNFFKIAFLEGCERAGCFK